MLNLFPVYCFQFPVMRDTDFLTVNSKLKTVNAKLTLSLSKQLLTFFNSVVDATNKVGCSFRVFIHFTVHDHVESTDGFFDRYEYTFQTSEGFRNMEWL